MKGIKVCLFNRSHYSVTIILLLSLSLKIDYTIQYKYNRLHEVVDFWLKPWSYVTLTGHPSWSPLLHNATIELCRLDGLSTALSRGFPINPDKQRLGGVLSPGRHAAYLGQRSLTGRRCAELSFSLHSSTMLWSVFNRESVRKAIMLLIMCSTF